MKLLITDAALDDIAAIGDYIAGDNPVRARSFVQELLDRCGELLDDPEAFPIALRHPEKGVRKRIWGCYLIFFRLRDDALEVLHVVHGARDYEHVLRRS